MCEEACCLKERRSYAICYNIISGWENVNEDRWQMIPGIGSGSGEGQRCGLVNNGSREGVTIV